MPRRILKKLRGRADGAAAGKPIEILFKDEARVGQKSSPKRAVVLLDFFRATTSSAVSDPVPQTSEELSAAPPPLSPMLRRLRKDQHLVDRLAVNPRSEEHTSELQSQ